MANGHFVKEIKRFYDVRISLTEANEMNDAIQKSTAKI